MFLSFEKKLRRSASASCTCKHKGLVHQNCPSNDAYNETTTLTLANDSLNVSSFAIYQNADITGINMNSDQTNKSMNTTPPTQVTSMRFGPRNNFGPVQHQHHQQSFRAQSSSCASTPILDSPSHLLRRQTSLGHLDSRTSDSNKATSTRNQTAEGRFGSFQQKIRSFLSPLKDSWKSEANLPTCSDTSAVKHFTDSIQRVQCLDTEQGSLEPSMSSVSSGQIPFGGATSMSHCSLATYNSFDDEDDSLYLRDVCNKWFGQKQSQIYSTKMASTVNKPYGPSDSPKVSHNLKPLLYDKIAPKDNICSGNNNVYVKSSGEYIQPSSTIHRNLTDQEVVEIVQDSQSQSCINDSATSDEYIVVVNGSENIESCDNCLTVRPPTVELTLDQRDASSCELQNDDAKDCSSSKVNNEPLECIDSAGSHENNYKSSSESGRGTMRSNLENLAKSSPIAISPLDLTSLDSDQSTPGLTISSWDKQNSPSIAYPQVHSSDATIGKMQRELQRILEDGSVGSNEVEVNELSKNLQARLSVVNESDSWISNTPPSTPQADARNPIKFADKKGDTKNMSVCSEVNHGKHKIDTNKNTCAKMLMTTSRSKQRNLLNDKQILSCNKQTSLNGKSNKCSKAKFQSNIKERTYNDELCYNSPTKYKLPNSSIHTKGFINLVDCDNASTTTARDSNAEYPEDLSSEYTVNTSYCERDALFNIRKQLHCLERMYEQIINMMGTRMRNKRRHIEHSGHRRRKAYGSVSSVTGRSSVTSRGTREYYTHRTAHEHRKNKTDDSGSASRRFKRLESHVMTLARSVAQVSAEMRSNHSISQELESLRQDLDSVKDELRSLKNMIPNGMSKPHHYNSSNGRRMELFSPSRVEKLTRFFGDEPPILRQFLKKLGYEKYARNFESEKIGIKELQYLSEERLHKLGIPLGPRLRIMQEAQMSTKMTTNYKDYYNVYAVV